MSEASPPQPSVAMALIILVALVPILGTLFFIINSLGLGDVAYAAFFFLFYWTGIMNRDPAQYLPSLIGGLCGLAIAWVFMGSAPVIGSAGPIVGIVLIFATIFCAIRGHLPMFVNNGNFLYITLATIPWLDIGKNVLPMSAALMVGGLYAGAVVLLLPKLIGKFVGFRNKAATTAA